MTLGPRNASLAKSGSLSLCTVALGDVSSGSLLKNNSNTSISAGYTTALSTAEPLYHGKSAFQDGPVSAFVPVIRICLDDRLFQGPDYRGLVLLAMTADIGAERANKLRDGPISRSVLEALEDCASTILPGEPVATVLQRLGLPQAFPHLLAYLTGSQLETDGKAPPGGSYLDYISLLNQLMMMATQLHNDALDPRNHKYSAHQIALLYQTFNMLRGQTKALRRRIEERFDEVKAITETSATPYLGADLQYWLQQITWDCRCMLVECPPYMHEKLQTISDVLLR